MANGVVVNSRMTSIIDDGVSGSPNVQPQFKIWNSALNRGFIFTSSQIINETSPWKKITACTSIDTFPLPNAGGFWTPIAPATIADWSLVASNVTDVIFVTEVSGDVGKLLVSIMYASLHKRS